RLHLVLRDEGWSLQHFLTQSVDIAIGESAATLTLSCHGAVLSLYGGQAGGAGKRAVLPLRTHSAPAEDSSAGLLCTDCVRWQGTVLRGGVQLCTEARAFSVNYLRRGANRYNSVRQ